MDQSTEGIIHNADNYARVYEKSGVLWVTHEELLACGYRNIEDFDVVFLNGEFYELQGHSDKAGAWWIEPVDESTLDIERA